MLKKSILVACVLFSNVTFAAPAQFDTIDKSYNLTCQRDESDEVFPGTLTIKAENYVEGTYLSIEANLNGRLSVSVIIPLADQLVLESISEDTFPKGYNYIETRYPKNQIIYKHLVKSGLFGRTGLQKGFHIIFSDSSLDQGSFEMTTYWPKKNQITTCALFEKH